MLPHYDIVDRYTYKDFTADTYDDGVRIYNAPGGRVPSVTTILSTLPKDALVAWRKRVGDAEADRITKEASDIGSNMHNMLETYVGEFLLRKPEPELNDSYIREAVGLANNLKRHCLPKLEEVWGIEIPLFCEGLYAGRTDLIGVYGRKPTIIDYKSARRPKRSDWIYSYRLQIAAYAVAHEAMIGEDVIEQGAILIAVRPNSFSDQRVQEFLMDKAELQKYKVLWLELVDKFYHG